MIQITESGRYEVTKSEPARTFDGWGFIWRLWHDDSCLYMLFLEVDCG